MDLGPDSGNVGIVNQGPEALQAALAAARMDPRDRLEALVMQGFPRREALRAVLAGLPGGRRRSAWPRVELAVELLNGGQISLAEAGDVLSGLGIHPASMLGAEMQPAPPNAPELLYGLGLAKGEAAESLDQFRRRRLTLSAIESMESLPAGIKLESLRLEHLPRLRSLGEGLEVAHELTLSSCGLLRDLPAQLDLLHLTIRSCSSFRKLSSSIRFDRGQFSDLPRLESIDLHTGFGGSISIRDCPRLTRLEFAGGSCDRLQIREAGLRDLDGLRRVGDLRVQGCPDLTRLDGPLDINGDLKLARLPTLGGLGPGIRIAHNLDLVAMHDGFELPSDLRVGGQIIVSPPCGTIVVPESLRGQLIEIP